MATMKDLLMQGYNPQVGQAAPSNYTPTTLGSIMPKAEKKDESWRKILGAISDGMLVFAGRNPIYGPGVRKKEDDAAEFEQQWNLAERQGQMQRANKEWEWQNKPQEPTTTQRDFGWYAGLDAPQRKQFSEYQDVIKPKFVTGADGRYYPAPSQGYDPNEWEVIEGDPATTPGTFP